MCSLLDRWVRVIVLLIFYICGGFALPASIVIVVWGGYGVALGAGGRVRTVLASVLEVLRHRDITEFLLLGCSESVHSSVWRRWNWFDLWLGGRLPAEGCRIEVPVVRGSLLIPISWEERVVVQRQGVGERHRVVEAVQRVEACRDARNRRWIEWFPRSHLCGGRRVM